jgi:hypothetical protein
MKSKEHLQQLLTSKQQDVYHILWLNGFSGAWDEATKLIYKRKMHKTKLKLNHYRQHLAIRLKQEETLKQYLSFDDEIIWELER